MIHLTERVIRCIRGTRNLAKSGLPHVALWFCACNFFAVSLVSQVQVDIPFGNTTKTSGNWPYQAGATIEADNGFIVNSSASVTFLAGTSIHLGPGFQATAGSAGTTFHAAIVPAPPPFVSSTSPLPGGVVGAPYSLALTASGGVQSYTWSLTAGTLPAGLSFFPSGVLSGTPTTAGPYSFSVKVTDFYGQIGTQALALTIASAPITITTNPQLTSGVTGQNYSAALTATGGAGGYNWVWIAGSLPPALNLPASGLLSGILQTAGVYSFTVRVTDGANNSATQIFSLTISASNPPAIGTPSPLPGGTVGFGYSMAFVVTGGSVPFGWSVLSGSLPPGLGLSSNGTLSGTPTTAGSYDYIVQVSDHFGQIASKSFRLTIQPASPMPVTASPSSQSVGPGISAVYTIQVGSGSGFNGTVSFGLAGLPPGATASFSPATLNGVGFTTLTVIPAGSSPTGMFPITITAQSGSVSHATTVFLTVTPASPASMLSPAPGAVLAGSIATFTWNSGSGASQYQLSLGSAPGGSNYYSANTGSAQSATANIPSGTPPATVYATLGSLIAGTWQSRAYSYAVGGGTSHEAPNAAAAAAQAQPDIYVYNDNHPLTWSRALYCRNGSQCGDSTLIDTGSVTVSGHGVSAVISAPSASSPSNTHSFDVTLTADYSAAPGPRTYTFTYNDPDGSYPLSDSFTVYDGTPHINFVQQYPPVTPGGPFYITLYGTNFGPAQGTLGVCAVGAPDLCKDHSTPNVSVGLNAPPYSYWSDNQINALLTPSPNASGTYDVQITSMGEGGLGFQSRTGQAAQSNRGQVTVTQPNPRITGISPDTIQIGASNVSVTIDGSGFGSSPAVNLPQGFTPAGQGSGDTRIVILVSVSADAQIGANSITVTVNNITSNPGTITVKSDVSMKLQVQGPVAISADGKYSEDTTIQVTAVRTDTGATITDFTGTVNLVEVAAASGTTIYSQNGGTLPSSVSITSGGMVTFVAKSLAGPKAEGATGAPPDAAQIKTTNYRVYGGANFAIPQWIVSGTTIDTRASGSVYDWVQARVKDIFTSATGDVATVLSAVSGYTTLAMDNYGSTALTAAAQSAIKINPYYKVHRIDSTDSALCGYPIVKSFTNTVLHEGRHAYLGAQSAIPGNDDDHDFLVKSIAIAPSTTVLDTTTPRDVCNDMGIVESRAYHGDSIFDSYMSPDYALYAIQMDAVIFAATH